jgi:hypothetical protein
MVGPPHLLDFTVKLVAYPATSIENGARGG